MWLLRFSMICVVVFFFFFFKQKTAYEMRISDWSSDVCSSDLQQESENCEKDRCEIHFSSIAKGYTNQAETLQHFMTLAQVRADYRRGSQSPALSYPTRFLTLAASLRTTKSPANAGQYLFGIFSCSSAAITIFRA